MIENSAVMGEYLKAGLLDVDSEYVKEIRGRGLFVGVELHPDAGGARRFTEALMKEGVLAKETQENVIRFAPPLIIKKDEVDWATERIGRVLKEG